MTARDDLSRRQLLRGRFLGGLLGGLAKDSDVPAITSSPSGAIGAPARARRGFPVHRPPGAVEESEFLRDCTRCDACVEACPHDAIIHAPPRLREAAGTPIIDAARQPCRMCDDLPCIAACEPGVLSALLAPVMGRAMIVEETCLAHQHSFCTVCSEQCPVEGAIILTDGKPRIDEDTCTGCGVCFHVCPAPSNAVIVMPRAERPSRPAPVKEAPDAS